MPIFPAGYDTITSDDLSGSEKLLTDDAGTKGLTVAEYKKWLNLVDVVAYSGDRTLVLTDAGKKLRATGALDHNVTIPLNSSVAFPIGTAIIFRVHGAGLPTFVPASGVTLNAAALAFTEQYQEGYIHKVGTDEWDVVIGGTSSGVDTTEPVLVSATVEDAHPDRMLLTYNEALNSSIVPDEADYTPSGGKTVSSINISGALVTLFLSGAYSNGDVITISYNGTGSATPVQDLAGNEADDLSAESVDNNISSYDADAIAYHTAASIVDTTTKSATNTLIVALKAIRSGGVWTNLKALYPLAGPNLAAQTYNAKNPANYQLTLNGSMVYHADGLNYDGVNDYAATDFFNDVDYTTPNEVCEGIVISTAPADGTCAFGVTGGGGAALYFFPKEASGNMIVALNDNTTVSTPNASAIGRYILNRTGASAVEIFKNGASLGGFSPAAGTLNSIETYYGALSNGGTAAAFTNSRHALYFKLDDSLSGPEQTAFDTAIANYLTAMGR
jgi:hypothetical protein